MAKRYFIYLLLLLTGQTGFSQKAISLEDIWKTGTFSSKGVSGFTPLKDGKTYGRKLSLKGGNQAVVRYSYETGAALDTLIHSAKIVANNNLKSFSFDSYSLNADETMAILSTETVAIYRHSTVSKCYLYNLKTGNLSLVSDNKIMYCTFDPNSTYLAYVWENNLYIKNINSQSIKAITEDGKKNSIINGAVDWVYEEEFGMSTGFQWNENGTSIAYYKFDESKVQEYSMTTYEGLYPQQNNFKYPKAGEDNSKVDVYVYSLKKGQSKKMMTGSENDQYLPRIKWTKNNAVLSIQRLNRLQNKWEILLANDSTGITSIAYEESDKYYIDITDDLTFLPGNEHMLITSEKNGFRHIYLLTLKGTEIAQVTKGNWEVADVLGFNKSNKLVYYTSFEVSPFEKHIYSVKLDGKGKKDLTPTPGMHSATFSADFSYFLQTTSTINTPSVTTINKGNGELVRILEDNKVLKEKLAEYKFSQSEINSITVNNTSLNYWMIKPKDFDPSKKYPMLMFVYGGPGSQQVTNAWGGGNYLWHQMLANEKGYIIACVDNRGTGARGAEFKKMTYKQLGKFESDDQISAAKYFGTMPFIDATRIGIWGWSYGGFMSSTCLTKGADVFKAAIAVAPVTNWRYYDNIYTERYMQLPKDNPDGYDNNSPISMVDKLNGKYLLVHGTGDDNVHFQNSVKMVEKMIELNKPFESAYYPDKNHGIYGGNTRLHLFTLMTNFILENL